MIFKNPKSILGFDDRVLVFIGILLNTHTVMAIYYTSAFFKVPFNTYIFRWSGEFLAITVLWLVIRWLYLILLKKYPGLKNQRKRFLIIPFFLIPYFLISIFYIYEVQPYFDWNLTAFPEPLVAVRIVTGIIIFFVDIGFYEGLHLFVELKDTKLKEEQLLKEKITSEMLVLKHQMDPHFLFNGMTTLLHLIDTDTQKAKNYVLKLSQIYNRLLQSKDQNLIPLKQEIDNTKVYSEVLRERFGKNLQVNFAVDEKHQGNTIVPFSLQMGVENAVKHNIISNKMPLKIQVLVDNDYLLIRNSLQLKRQIKKVNGYGLKNIADRYVLLSDKEVITEQDERSFVLKLPLLPTP